MQRTILIVDDFLDNATQLREAALRLDYPARDDRGYHGRNSNKRILVEGIDGAVSRLVGEPLQPIDPMHSHGRFRITLDGEEGLSDIHIDQSHWSGILYLTPDEHCQGGTDFFRHIPTNSDRIPMDEAGVRAQGYDSYQALHEDVIQKDTKDRSKWEHIMRVPMRFNRLVLLRPWLYHTSAPGFGTSMDDGRLVYVLFFRPQPQQHQGIASGGFVQARR
jgi:hypothetical protein